MRRAAIAGGTSAVVLALVVLAVGRSREGNGAPPAVGTATTPAATPGGGGLLHGRVTTDDGDVYEGRLRFGGDEEALWGNYFNGAKADNRWASYVPREQLLVREPIEVFGIRLGTWRHKPDLARPFMVRFGDIARLDARGRDLRVTLKNGTTVDLDRFGADDYADGLRLWDASGSVIELDEWHVRSIEFLDAPPTGDAAPLYGTVRTSRGDFTGSVQWGREAYLTSDELEGRTVDGAVRVPFSAIRSISRGSANGYVVSRLGGGDLDISEPRAFGARPPSIYVDDPRYGRVMVSWSAFERVDFRSGGAGSAYSDFSPGRPLQGAVTTRDGLRLTGRLVYDLDESETTETVDAPARGIDYTIPFRLVTSIVPPRDLGAGPATVTLRSGEQLSLEPVGDLGPSNLGLLVFVDDGDRPVYVRWADVERIDLDATVEGSPHSE